MRQSPRIRRLHNDFKAMEQLRDKSSILDFSVPGAMHGGPPEVYVVRFDGRGFWKPEDSNEVVIRDKHEVTIKLGASYPRQIPELQWRSPIFHPNISGSGVVCLGGYSTHWAPSLQLDELCTMLWDMIRYQNFDVDSPYNRAAAIWAKTQKRFHLPIDARPIRDAMEDSELMADVAKPADAKKPESNYMPLPPPPTISASGVDAHLGDNAFDTLVANALRTDSSRGAPPTAPIAETPDIMFLDDDAEEIIDAEVIEVDTSGREMSSDAPLIEWL